MGRALQLVGENFVADRDPKDEAIEKLEAALSKQAEHETYLWGGPKGEGVIPSLKHLGETVTQLATTVATLATRVTGEDGLAVQVRDLRIEVAKQAADRERIAFEDKLERERLHRENQARIDRVWRIITPALTAILLALGGLVWRSVFVAQHGVMVAH
jgi:hypothetical protein